MKTSIIKLKRQNKTINLIGICHIGTEEYYLEIKKHLQTINNILYESIDSEGSSDNLDLDFAFEFLGKFLGDNIHSQKEFIDCNTGERCDISIKLIDTVGGKKSELYQIEKKIAYIKDKLWTKLDKMSKLSFFLIKFVVKALIPFVLLRNKSSYEVVEFRNNYVIHKIFEKLIEDNEVSILYGERHIQGIYKVLKRLSFKTESKIILRAF